MRIAIHSLGCKVNTYEAQKMAEALTKSGHEIVAFNDFAEVYIINTCSVTNVADHKSRQMLHRARGLNPKALVVAAGCYANTHDRESVLKEGVDLVVTNEEKKHIAKLIEAAAVPEVEPAGTDEKKTGRGRVDRTRMFIKVQDGCNMFCSYCIIPYARGRIMSPPSDEIIKDVKEYVSKGYAEFVLTGIHLSSYGKDRPADGEDLICLTERLAGVEGVKRIRLSSLEPAIVNREFAERMSAVPVLCPHFHLSLQSGSDSVLKRMNRHYTTEMYYEGVSLLREYFDNPALTTDVIVGFPGETDTEFEETVEFLEKVNFYETHVFKYSRRKGTVADRMPGQLTNAQKTERERVLLKMTVQRKRAYADLYVGRPVEVLFEENSEGYTREYVRVRCSSGPVREGDILTGYITGRLNDDIMDFVQDQ